MNVAVCVKQIPDPATPGQLDPNTNWLKRDGKLILDDSDAYGVEMALQLVTAAGGGEVTLVSMAPNNEVSGLRTGLAMGAAKAILVSDPALAGSDALSTAKVLGAAIKRAEPGKLEADNTLDRSGKIILDDSDAYGVEMALQLAEAAGGGEVTLVSMAPNGETSGLRTALAMGAAKAIVVSDPALAGSDSLSTAKVLAKAIQRAEPDLVIAATESSDGYTGTVPEQIAALLDLPSVTFAKHIEIADGTAKVQRQTELGYDEVEVPLPAVVSVTAGVVEPRYPSFKGIMAAKSKPVDQVTVADLGIDGSQVGWAGAGQEIVSVADAEARQAGEIIEDDGEAFNKIVEFLDKLKVI